MASRKTPTSRRSSRKRPGRKPASKEKSAFKVPLLVSVFIFSLLCTCFAWMGRKSILIYVVNWHCVKPLPRDDGIEVLYNAVNLYHQIYENEGQKEKFLNLLADRVYWFKSPAKKKERLRFGGDPYDCFCFVSYPTYTESNTTTNDFSINFDGFHRYRRPNGKLIELESGSAEVEQKKVTKVKPFEAYRGQTLEYINDIYRYFFWIAWGVLFVLSLALSWLPKTIIGNLFEYLVRKII